MNVVELIADVFEGIFIEQVVNIESKPEEQMQQNSLQVSHQTEIVKWEDSVARALKSQEARQQIIGKVLVKDKDFGEIPGVKNPCLFKSGAEKIVDAFNCYVDFVPETVVEDFSMPVFFYRYRAIMRARGTGEIVSVGIGSCNSREKKYRYINNKARCGSCGSENTMKSKHNAGKTYCWDCKKESDTPKNVGKIENPDIFDQINTVDKMAQKRAFVAAVLLAGFSQNFTQDLEDFRENEAAQEQEEEKGPVAPAERPKTSTVPKVKITPAAIENPAMITTKQAKIEEAEIVEEFVKAEAAIVGPEQLAKIGETRQVQKLEKKWVDDYVKSQFNKKVPEMTIGEFDKLIAFMNTGIPDMIYDKLKQAIGGAYKNFNISAALLAENKFCRENYGCSVNHLSNKQLPEFVAGIPLRAKAASGK